MSFFKNHNYFHQNPNFIPVIWGVSGLKLQAEEKFFFKESQPLGFILFQRNCHNPDQVKALIDDLIQCVDHTPVPILIDQEGGRVQRLLPPNWPDFPALGTFQDDPLDVAVEKVYEHGFKIGEILKGLGITANCAPCCDLLIPGADPIIGDRSLGADPLRVSTLALSFIIGLMRSKILPIIKHIPGHGRAPVDSHKYLPRVQESLETLMKTDFLAFQKISELWREMDYRDMFDLPFDMPWAMTAHVLYEKIDPNFPATYSKIITQEIIRNQIGFPGIIISDCITMEALSEGGAVSMGERAVRTLKGGCDVVLHCNGNLSEMQEIETALKSI